MHDVRIFMERTFFYRGRHGKESEEGKEDREGSHEEGGKEDFQEEEITVSTILCSRGIAAKHDIRTVRRRPKCIAATTMQCIYSSVSKASLQKTGILLNSAGDFREFSPKKFENGATGDFQQLEKPAIGGPFWH